MKIEAPIRNADYKNTKQLTPDSWRAAVAPYQKPSLWRSCWQLANTFIPFLGVLYLMYFTLNINFWLTVALAPLAAGLQLRTFIIFHDCGHGSFFKSRQLNSLVGIITGIICFTPYQDWWHLHAMHHATSGNLDRRSANQSYPAEVMKNIEDGYGLLLFTIQEYQQLNRWQKLGYQLYRHPLFLFGLIPAIQFLIIQRFTVARQGKRERKSVHVTNLALLAISVLMIFLVGFGPFLIVTLLVTIPSSITGVWLFYIQHQFERVYWKPQAEWNYTEAALAGSSFYKLPGVLQWFTGSIGFHHIHHLSPRIPNYYLAKCHAESNLDLQQVSVITLRTGLKSLTLSLWDIEQQKMVGFKQLKNL